MVNSVYRKGISDLIFVCVFLLNKNAFTRAFEKLDVVPFKTQIKRTSTFLARGGGLVIRLRYKFIRPSFVETAAGLSFGHRCSWSLVGAATLDARRGEQDSLAAAHGKRAMMVKATARNIPLPRCCTRGGRAAAR